MSNSGSASSSAAAGGAAARVTATANRPRKSDASSARPSRTPICGASNSPGIPARNSTAAARESSSSTGRSGYANPIGSPGAPFPLPTSTSGPCGTAISAPSTASNPTSGSTTCFAAAADGSRTPVRLRRSDSSAPSQSPSCSRARTPTRSPAASNPSPICRSNPPSGAICGGGKRASESASRTGGRISRQRAVRGRGRLRATVRYDGGATPQRAAPTTTADSRRWP